MLFKPINVNVGSRSENEYLYSLYITMFCAFVSLVSMAENVLLLDLVGIFVTSFLEIEVAQSKQKRQRQI